MSFTSPHWLLAFLLAFLFSCDEALVGYAHPDDHLSYPTQVYADPSGESVWVLSGNYNLAYRSGAVLAYDVLENRFRKDSAFEIGSYPSSMSIYAKDGESQAIYVTSRESGRLYSVALKGGEKDPIPSCAGGKISGGILHCPSSKAIKRRTLKALPKDLHLSLGSDPFRSIVRHSKLPHVPDLLFVGSLEEGRLSQLTLEDPTAPKLVGQLDLGEGLYGLGLNPESGQLYSSSKLKASLSIFDIMPQEDPVSSPPGNPWLSLSHEIKFPEPINTIDRARDMALSKDGTRLYLSYRSPSSILVIDLSQEPKLIKKIATCADPTALLVHEEEGQELLYLACYNSAQVQVIDPLSGLVVDSIKTGDGPTSLAIIDRPDLGIQRLYVALFSASALGIVELDPSSPFYHQEIAEIR